MQLDPAGQSSDQASNWRPMREGEEQRIFFFFFFLPTCVSATAGQNSYFFAFCLIC